MEWHCSHNKVAEISYLLGASNNEFIEESSFWIRYLKGLLGPTFLLVIVSLFEECKEAVLW